MVEALNVLLGRLPPALMALAVFASSVDGHVLDEYLQSMLVAIEPGEIRLHVNLTPGVEIADKVLILIDRDGDNEISPEEAAAYGESLRRDFNVRLDGRDVALKLVAAGTPAPADLRTGMGIIKMEFAIAPGLLAAGAHRLSVENRHLPSLGVYLINAALPSSGAIQITKQNRNQNQSLGEIEFALSRPADSLRVVGWMVSLVVVLGAVYIGARRVRKARPRLL